MSRCAPEVAVRRLPLRAAPTGAARTPGRAATTVGRAAVPRVTMAQNMLPSHHDEQIPSAVQGQGQPSNRPDLKRAVAGYDDDGSGMHAQANIYHLVST